jgi:hypothetical protein
MPESQVKPKPKMNVGLITLLVLIGIWLRAKKTDVVAVPFTSLSSVIIDNPRFGIDIDSGIILKAIVATVMIWLIFVLKR